MRCEGQRHGDPPTPTLCSWQEPEPPLPLPAMGEMEQLRQEAEQLKKQIAVTPEPSHQGTPENKEPGRAGVGPAGEEGWIHP